LPPNWMLVVGGLIFVWAVAVSVTNAKRIKQISARAKIFGPQPAAVVRVEGLICAFPVTELQLHELFLLIGKAFHP
jgi:hypothetical protein